MARLALLAILFLTNNLNKIMMMFNKRISFLNGKFIDHQKAWFTINIQLHNGLEPGGKDDARRGQVKGGGLRDGNDQEGQ